MENLADVTDQTLVKILTTIFERLTRIEVRLNEMASSIARVDARLSGHDQDIDNLEKK